MSLMQLIENNSHQNRSLSCDKLLFSPTAGFWSTRFGWVRDETLADRYAPSVFVDGLTRVNPKRDMRMLPVESVEMCEQSTFCDMVWEVLCARRYFEEDISQEVLTYMTPAELCQLFNGVQSQRVAYFVIGSTYLLVDADQIKARR